MCGNSAYCWKTVLTSRRYGGVPTASTPPIRISPSSGCSKPAIIRRDVVLPQPDGPRSERNSPLRTWKETASTAFRSPKRLVTARNSTSYAESGPPELTVRCLPHGHRPSRALPLLSRNVTSPKSQVNARDQLRDRFETSDSEVSGRQALPNRRSRGRIDLDRPPQREAVDVRPEDVGEDQLGVRRLPEHE